ncbi:amino acid transporter [Aulographum hederae CBS 113979]|uniref:Amino acid transporter n=1 Tax=Aulographum hederae CBS 113979 TaxID=1176131 RepID=A0A6G1HDE9_9PEZI|nr:amino acid transporter [Aulographum hederae CBS 113979]
MAKDDMRNARKTEQHRPDDEEARDLLSDNSDADDIAGPSPEPANYIPRGPQRQSSFAQPRPDGHPRTPNRVRFEMERESLEQSNGHAAHPAWIDEEDFLTSEGGRGDQRRDSDVQRLPLLTDIEAPTVTVANADIGFNAEDLLESARPKSGMRSAFMNMANSIIGAGIIGQPYAFRQAGLITGIFLLVALTVTVDWTINLIVINSKLSGANSFQSTVQHCFGKPGLIAISVAQWAFAFGGMVAFCIIVGDTIPHVMAAIFPSLPETPFLWLLTDRRAVIVLFILGISYPLSLYRDIAKLAKASTLALISMLVILVTIITQGARIPSDLRGQLKGSIFINDGIFQAIGVISFAFVCHHNSLLIYGSLKTPTLDRFAKVTHYSTSISMVACLAMALSGYLTFGDKTQGNVLNNFPVDNIVVNIARLCFGLNMLTTLPLEAFVCREVMTHYYFPDEPFNPHRHLIFSTTLVLSAMGLSLFTCDLGSVFELIGATSACALAYILPPLCYIKLSTRSWKTVAAYICVVFGCIVMGISLVLAVAKMIRNEGGTQTCG